MTDTSAASPARNPAFAWVGIIACVYLLLVAIGCIGTGFKTAAGDQAKELFAFATNPFIGLLIGTLATALIQSSSTVTSVIVGLVAGGLPVGIAVPMIMGANIGTTITNSIVSLGHVRDAEEFKRACSAATVHDFFNVMMVVVFLPLEIMTGFLQKTAMWLAGGLVGAESMSIKGMNFVKPMTKPVVGLFKDLFKATGLPETGVGVAMAVFGVALIFGAILYIGKLLKSVMVGRAKAVLHSAIGRGPLSGIASGTAVTVAVQSSSTTTSLMVPFAGTGVFTTRDIYPFTLGANIGTTVTALLAATAASGATAAAALTIALVHLLYNVIGVLALFVIPHFARLTVLSDFPVRAAEWLAGVASQRKTVALAYILGTFFVVPGLMVFMFK